MDLKGLRVLVVEDEPLIAALVSDMLVDLGCVPVGPAATLDDAQTLAANETFDAALLDVRLKGQDVFPLAQALLGRNVRIVFMSGSSVHSLPTQWQGYRSIGKPFSCEDIAAALQSLSTHHVPWPAPDFIGWPFQGPLDSARGSSPGAKEDPAIKAGLSVSSTDALQASRLRCASGPCPETVRHP